MSTLSVAAAGALAYMIGGPAAALFAAAFAAFDPGQILSVTRLSLHGFYGLTILALAAAAALSAAAPAPGKPALVGLSLAGTLLCRPAHFLAAPLLALLAARRSGLRAAASVLFWVSLGLLPWTVRNAVRLGGFVPLNVGGGSYSLLAASQGGTEAASIPEGYRLAESLRPGFHARYPYPLEAEGALRALAYEEIARRPGRFLEGCARRLLKFWLPFWPLVLLAGYAFTRFRSDAALAVGCVTASFAAYAAIGGNPGYELGAAPSLHVLAGCGAAAVLARAGEPAVPDAALTGRARNALLAWSGLLLALTAGVQVWSLADALRAGRPAAAYTGPRVLSVLSRGSVISGGRWRKSVTPEELRAKPLRNEGVRLYLAGRIEEAVESFRAAVAASPRGAQDRLNLCVALGRVGRGKEALEHCDRAVALTRDPELRASALSSRASLRKP